MNSIATSSQLSFRAKLTVFYNFSGQAVFTTVAKPLLCKKFWHTRKYNDPAKRQFFGFLQVSAQQVAYLVPTPLLVDQRLTSGSRQDRYHRYIVMRSQ